MQRNARWLCLFLLFVTLGCGENSSKTQQQQHNDVPIVQNLEHDYSALVAQFNADSAKVRMLMMLSPT